MAVDLTDLLVRVVWTQLHSDKPFPTAKAKPAKRQGIVPGRDTYEYYGDPGGEFNFDNEAPGWGPVEVDPSKAKHADHQYPYGDGEVVVDGRRKPKPPPKPQPNPAPANVRPNWADGTGTTGGGGTTKRM